MLAYLKLFAQEGLGRPDLEINTDVENLKAALKKSLGEDQPLPNINVVLVFSDDRAVLQADDAPYPTIKLDQLKDLFRKTAKQNPLPASEIKRITDVLPDESVE